MYRIKNKISVVFFLFVFCLNFQSADAQFYNFNFVNDQFDLVIHDCGTEELSIACMPNIVNITPAMMEFADIEGLNCEVNSTTNNSGNCSNPVGGPPYSPIQGGDNSSLYETNAIDITNRCNVTMTVNYTVVNFSSIISANNLDCGVSSGQDVLIFEYSLDNGSSWLPLNVAQPNVICPPANGNISGNTYNFTSPSFNGTTVKFRMLFGMQSVTEGLRINSLQLFEQPGPNVNQPANQMACSGDPISTIFNGTGSSYTWTNDNPSIGLGASGTGNISFTGANVVTQEVATITVTPQGVCTGSPKSFTITINPTQDVDQPANQSACSGDPLSVFFSGSGSSYSWTNNNVFIGLGASGTGNISFNGANVLSQEVATITVTPIGSCPGLPKTFDITISPSTNVNQPANQTICSGEPVFIALNGTASSYTWANNNTLVGLGLSGTGDINFNAANVGSSQTATITVSPQGACPGLPKTFTILVNPAPNVNQPADQTACSGENLTISFSGTGSSYTWTNDNTSVGLGSSGTGNINFIASNVVFPQTSSITVTPQGSCPGTPKTFFITINPLVTTILDPLGPYCTSDNFVSLPDFQNGVSGSWFGTGVFFGNQFAPSSVGSGNFNLTFNPNPGQCASPNSTNVNVIENPAGNLAGVPVLCPGQCGQVTFNFNGGSGVFNVNMNITAGFFNHSFLMAAVTNSTVLTLCYANGTPFDAATNTINIPSGVTPGNHALTILNFNSASGGPCSSGIIGFPGSLSVTLSANPPASGTSLNMCDLDQNGTETFNLNSANNTVKNNIAANTVVWFTDLSASNPISNSTAYISGNTTVYAQVSNPNGCKTVVPVTLSLSTPASLLLSNFASCINGPLLPLPSTVSGVSGQWSGPNVISGGTLFDPTGLAAASYPIIFMPNTGSCALPLTVDVVISSAGPVPLLSPISTVCLGEGAINLNTNQGGVTGIWSGDVNLIGNVFNIPATGTFTLTFTPTSSGSCFTENTTQLVVVPNIDLTPVSFPIQCSIGSPVLNLGNSVDGISGNWSGNPQVFNNTFDPNVTSGIYPLIFTPFDVCFNALPSTVEVIPVATLTPPVLGPTCINGAPIILPATVNLFPGSWTYNGTPITVFNPVIAGDFVLNFTVASGYCAFPLSDTISVNPFNAGPDSLQSICQTSASTINLDNYLFGSVTPGGTWEFNNQVIANPTNYDLSLLQAGVNVFSYLLNDAICGKDTAKVTFAISAKNNAGLDSNISFCSNNTDNINFNTFLGTIDTGGIWTITPDSMIDLSDLNDVSLSALPPGAYNFIYIIAEDLCTADTAQTSIDIFPFNSAGIDNISTLCLGTDIDLINLVNSTYLAGTILNPAGIPGLAGSVWTTAGLSPGPYSFQYATTSQNPCPRDTSNLIINLASSLSAGNDLSDFYCEGETLLLDSYLPPNASVGGKFYLNGTEVINGTYPTSNATTLQFIYTVGDGLTCPKDSSILTLGSVSKPVLTISGIEDICEKDCHEIVIGHNLPAGTNISLSATSSTGTIYSLNDVMVSNNPLLLNVCPTKTGPFTLNNLPSGENFIFRVENVSLQAGNCIFGYSETYTFNTNDLPSRNISRALCNGQSLMVGTDVYNESKPTGTTIIPSLDPTKCDSLINVSLTFNNVSPVTNINTSTCDQNYSLQVGTMTFNKTNPIGNVTLQNISGCDSLVNINLQFSLPSTGSFIQTTCDTNATFIIGNQVFDKVTPEGNVTLSGANVSGCDSVVNVKITYLNASTFLLSRETCDETFVFLAGGQTFNKMNPTGTVTLVGQATNGCDSIVMVELKFLDMPEGNFNVNTCDDSYTYMAGNTVFNKLNPSGKIILPAGGMNGCDSIVNVQINFTDFTISNSLKYNCDGTDAEVTLNLASHPGPYVISIDGNIIAGNLNLPFLTPLSQGMHQLIISTPDGCKDSVLVNVEDSKGPIVELTQVTNSDGTVQINVIAPQNVIYNLIWKPAASLNCNNCFNPIANPAETTTYTLDYKYNTDCSGQKNITIEKINADITLPNIFSPNYDGSNDVFYVFLPDNVSGTVKTMNIYDRWGNLMFSAKNVPANTPSAGWDGDFNSNKVQPGVYVYFIELQLDGKQITDRYIGDLLLVR